VLSVIILNKEKSVLQSRYFFISSRNMTVKVRMTDTLMYRFMFQRILLEILSTTKKKCTSSGIVIYLTITGGLMI
jgi:hypothetical protein